MSTGRLRRMDRRIAIPASGLVNHPRLKARACDCSGKPPEAKRMRHSILNHVTFGRFRAALPDIVGSVDIGMRLVSARATPKLSLITTVALLAAATLGARPAGVARIQKPHQDSCQRRLISHHLAQLPAPSVQRGSLAVPNFCQIGRASCRERVLRLV